MSQTLTMGEKIRMLRGRKRLSQRRLADQIGWTASHLSRVEADHHMPTVAGLVKLAQGLEVSTDYLLSEEAEEPSASPEVSIRHQPLAERLRLVDSLDPEDQQALFRVLDAMLTNRRLREILGTAAPSGS